MKKEKTGKTEKREPGRPSRYSAALAERIYGAGTVSERLLKRRASLILPS